MRMFAIVGAWDHQLTHVRCRSISQACSCESGLRWTRVRKRCTANPAWELLRFRACTGSRDASPVPTRYRTPDIVVES